MTGIPPGLRAGLLAVLLGTAPAAAALRCDGAIIREGERADRVRSLCGEPDFIDQRPPLAVNLYSPVPGGEDWYYNFGPQRLIAVLRIRDGRVRELDTDGHGLSGEPPQKCGPYDIRSGMSKFRLVWECGDPVAREYYNTFQPLDPRDPRRGHRPVQIEKWFYTFGSRHFDRQVRLTNGRVTDVDVAD